MTISKEVKIGLLALVAIALSFWGYKFILGKNLLVKSNYYQVVYATVDGLRVGTAVRINGVPVGSVSSIELMPEDVNKKVLVLLDLRRDIKIPKDTRAVIMNTSFMGDKSIDLQYARPCAEGDCAETGAFLKGETLGLLGSMLGKDDAKDYVDILKTGLQELIDTLNHQLLSDDSNSALAKSMRDLQGTLANLNSATGRIDGLLAQSSGKINGTLTNFNSLSATLAGKKDQIGGIIDNTAAMTKQLSEAELDKTLAEFSAAVTNLKATAASADKALNNISSLVDNIKEGDGSLSKLIRDDELYNNLNQLGARADSLMNDVQDRPYRYIPFKSRNKVKRMDKLDAKEGQ